jgi:alpha-L-fucosidase 2
MRDVISSIREALASGNYPEADRRAKGLQGPTTQSYLPLGNLHLSLTVGAVVTAYARDLDLRTAIATTSFTMGEITFEREALASAPDQVIAVRVRATEEGRLSFLARLSSPIEHRVGALDASCLLLSGRGPVHVEPSYRHAEPAVVYQEGRGLPFVVALRVITDGRSTCDPMGLRVTNASVATLIVTSRTGFSGYQSEPSSEREVAERVLSESLDASRKGYDAIRNDHIADHQRFFDRVEIDLGRTELAHLPTDERIRRTAGGASDPQLIALLFQYGRYLLLASSRPGSQPANLQGIWNQEMRPPWSSNYTININTQMNYWPAEVTHLEECHDPLLRFVEELAEASGYP